MLSSTHTELHELKIGLDYYLFSSFTLIAD